jgi:hypothetical protein
VTVSGEPGQSPPIGPPLDEHGHFPPGGDYDLWHLAAWIPAGREAAVAELLAGQGIEVYRMWPASGPGHG